MAFSKFGKRFGKNKKEASKFKIKTIYQHLECELVRGYLPSNISIKWSRGQRDVCSSSPKWESVSEDDSVTEGKAIFDPPCESELIITLYRNQKDVQYEEKIYKYSVEDIDVDRKKRLMGVFELNISEYASMGNTTSEIVMQCSTASKKVFSLKVFVTLDVEFIKSGKPQDDDLISTWSTIQFDNAKLSDESDNSDGGHPKHSLDSSLYIALGEQPYTYFSNHKSDFVFPSKNEVDLEYLSECKAIGLLFSANWSDSCVKFLQLANAFYINAMVNYQKSFELIYVSSDYEEANLMQAISKNNITFPCIMPDSDLKEILKDHFEIHSLPQLIIINPRTGKLIDKDGRNRIEKSRNSEENLKKLIICWMKGKSGDKQSEVISKGMFGSILSLNTVSEVSPLNPSVVAPNKRKVSLRIGKESNEQTISNLESMNKKLNLQLTENNEYISMLQTEIHELIKENETLKTRNFGYKEENLELQEIILKYRSENSTLVAEKKQLAVSMDIRGWLFKRGVSGPTGKKWRKRYFTINGTQLYYFKSMNAVDPQGYIDINKIQHMSVLPSISQDKNEASFNIVTLLRTYELQAKSKNDMERWMKAVQYTVDYLTTYRFSKISAPDFESNISSMSPNASDTEKYQNQLSPSDISPAICKEPTPENDSNTLEDILEDTLPNGVVVQMSNN